MLLSPVAAQEPELAAPDLAGLSPDMATLRRIAQNQIKLDASKGSQKTKRKRMGWSDDYLQGLFGLTPGSVSHAQTSSDG